MILITVLPREFSGRKTRTSHGIKSHDICTSQVVFDLFKCLIENIVQSNQSYSVTPYLISYLDSTTAPQGKLLEEELHFSSLLWSFPRWFCLLLWNDIIQLCQWHILHINVRCCQEKHEAVSLADFRLAWTKSKEKTAVLYWLSQ